MQFEDPPSTSDRLKKQAPGKADQGTMMLKLSGDEKPALP